VVDTAEAAPARAPVAGKPPTPRRLQKRKLTLAEAAEQWERSKREIERQKPLLEEAAGVLLAHFEKTERGSYKDRIGWSWSGGGLVLDQAAVRAFLGARLGEFQKRATRSRSLRLLK
jgi:hypothetical protein